MKEDEVLRLDSKTISVQTVKAIKKGITSVQIFRSTFAKKAFELFVKKPFRRLCFVLCDLVPEEITLLKKLSQLNSIGFKTIELSQTQVDKLCEVLVELPHFRFLELSECRISSASLPPISRITSLIELDLSDNDIEQGIPHHLLKLTNLKKLFLKNNLIGDEGAHQLIKLQLSRLDLIGCNLSFEGALYVARMTTLKHLEIHYNPIGNSGVLKLVKVRGLGYLGYDEETGVTEWGADVVRRFTQGREELEGQDQN